MRRSETLCSIFESKRSKFSLHRPFNSTFLGRNLVKVIRWFCTALLFLRITSQPSCKRGTGDLIKMMIVEENHYWNFRLRLLLAQMRLKVLRMCIRQGVSVLPSSTSSSRAQIVDVQLVIMQIKFPASYIIKQKVKGNDIIGFNILLSFLMRFLAPKKGKFGPYYTTLLRYTSYQFWCRNRFSPHKGKNNRSLQAQKR